MRNPYNKHYYEFDELCVVFNQLEVQAVYNFMINWDIDCECGPPFDRGLKGAKSVMVKKGYLNKSELKEARDALSGLLWAIRLPWTPEYIEGMRKKKL